MKFKRTAKLSKAGTRSMLLRVLFAVYGSKVILLLGGYDKGRHPQKAHQQKHIQSALTRLADWRRRNLAS